MSTAKLEGCRSLVSLKIDEEVPQVLKWDASEAFKDCLADS